MTVRYMKEEEIQKLVDIMWQCVCTPWYPEYRDHFGKMDIEQLADWTAEQLRTRFPAGPVGSIRLRLRSSNFETIKPPTYMTDLLVGYKALAMDYKYALETIADEGLTATAAADLATKYLGVESQNSRDYIESARQERDRGEQSSSSFGFAVPPYGSGSVRG